jgi:hypothetical protein
VTVRAQRQLVATAGQQPLGRPHALFERRVQQRRQRTALTLEGDDRLVPVDRLLYVLHRLRPANVDDDASQPCVVC